MTSIREKIERGDKIITVEPQMGGYIDYSEEITRRSCPQCENHIFESYDRGGFEFLRCVFCDWSGPECRSRLRSIDHDQSL